jgi:hypothetical protein
MFKTMIVAIFLSHGTAWDGTGWGGIEVSSVDRSYQSRAVCLKESRELLTYILGMDGEVESLIMCKHYPLTEGE